MPIHNIIYHVVLRYHEYKKIKQIFPLYYYTILNIRGLRFKIFLTPLIYKCSGNSVSAIDCTYTHQNQNISFKKRISDDIQDIRTAVTEHDPGRGF